MFESENSGIYFIDFDNWIHDCKNSVANRQGSEMSTSVYGTIQRPPYWNGWALSACMHTVVVGVVLFLSQQLSVPQKAAPTPIAVAFVTPQPTHTAPTHRQTMKKSPPTPTLTPKQVQTEVIPREPTQSKPHAQTQPRQKVSAQTVVHASPKPAPLSKVQVTNATPISVAQPKTVRHTQTTHQPAVSSGVITSQPMPQHTDIAQQHAAPKVHGSPSKIHASPSHKKPIHVEAKTNKVDPMTPRDPIIRNHVTNIPQPMATRVKSAPLRQSVSTLPSHEVKRSRAPAMEAMKQHVTREKSHATARHVFSKAARQQTSLSSGNHVVQTRTTVNYTRQTRKARPVTTTKSASTGGLSPELLAFSKLLREKVARTLTFPRLAKRLGYTGTTHVAIALSKTGIVRDLKVSQPSGYEILDKAAIVTLQKVLQTTKPPESVEIEQLVIPIAFNLKRN